MGHVLVIGYGNELAGDDGVGRLIAEQLASDPRLAGAEVLSERQLMPELALDASRATTLILIDANRRSQPGELTVRPLVPSHGHSAAWSHHMTPAAMLALANELYHATPTAFVVSVGVESLELGDEVSPAVRSAVPRAVEAVARIVADQQRA